MKKLISLFFSALALLLIFEEWLWEQLSALMARIGKLSIIYWLESRLRTLSPHQALACLTIPWILLLPAKVSALWLLSHGHAISGIGVVILVKVGGTALVARIFNLTREKVLSISWFNRCYGFVMRKLEWAHNLVRQTEAYRAIRIQLEKIKDWWKMRRNSTKRPRDQENKK